MWGSFIGYMYYSLQPCEEVMTLMLMDNHHSIAGGAKIKYLGEGSSDKSRCNAGGGHRSDTY